MLPWVSTLPSPSPDWGQHPYPPPNGRPTSLSHPDGLGASPGASPQFQSQFPQGLVHVVVHQVDLLGSQSQQLRWHRETVAPLPPICPEGASPLPPPPRPCGPWNAADRLPRCPQLTGPGHAAPVGIHEPPRPKQDQLGVPEGGQGEVGGAAAVTGPALRHTQPQRQLPQHRHPHAVPRAGQSGVPQAGHLQAAPGKLRPRELPTPAISQCPLEPKAEGGRHKAGTARGRGAKRGPGRKPGASRRLGGAGTGAARGRGSSRERGAPPSMRPISKSKTTLSKESGGSVGEFGPEAPTPPR